MGAASSSVLVRAGPRGALLLSLAFAGACATPSAPKPSLADPAAAERQAFARRALSVLRDASHSEDSEARALAALTWGALGNAAARPLLRNLMDDMDASVQVAAAAALASLRDESGVAVLKAVIKRRPQPAGDNPLLQTKADRLNRARARAVKALAELEGPSAASLLQVLRSDPSPEVRDAAASEAAKVAGSEEAFKSFIPLLRSSEEGERLRAVRALAEAADERAEELLKGAFQDPSLQVRLEAVRGLGRRGSLLGLPEIEAAASARESELRRAALEALGGLKDPAVLPVLERERAAAQDDYDRLLVWRALARSGRAGGLEPAEAGLRFSDPEARLAALEGLEAAGGPEALRLAAGALDDGEARVRLRAAEAVLRLARARGRS